MVENEKLIVKNDKIAKICNKHFSEAVDKLNTFEWPSCETKGTEDQLNDIINKYKSHPSIKKISLLSKNLFLSQLLLKILTMLLKIFLLTKLLEVKFF